MLASERIALVGWQNAMLHCRTFLVSTGTKPVQHRNLFPRKSDTNTFTIIDTNENPIYTVDK